MLVAMAVGLGSMDMPIPQVAAWEWVNWKFPKAVHSGETIFARWTLTQKRPPVHGSPTGIAVWHVDVMTTDGAVCADGDVGATVFRQSGAHAEKAAAEPVARPRRRRRRGSGQAETTAAPAAPPAPAAAERPPAAERPAGGSRRRRRKRGGSSGNGNGGGAGDHAGSTPPAEQPVPAPAPVVATPAAPAQTAAPKGRLSQVMRRLRRT